MLRNVLGVVGGYLVTAVLVALLLTAAYLRLGTEGAFKEGSYEVTGAWLATSFALGLVAAVIGGLACAFIAKRGSSAPIALASLVLLLGLLSAGFQMADSGSDPPQIRGDEVSSYDAMLNAKQPTAALVGNPVIGAVGVIIGARLARRRSPAEAAPQAEDQ